MLKNFFFVFLFSILIFNISSPVLAQDYGLKATAEKAQYEETTSIYSAISRIIKVGLSMVGIVFLAIMFYAGLRWMTARGNEELATKAKDAVFNAILGFILVSIAYGLTAFIFGKLVK